MTTIKSFSIDSTLDTIISLSKVDKGLKIFKKNNENYENRGELVVILFDAIIFRDMTL